MEPRTAAQEGNVGVSGGSHEGNLHRTDSRVVRNSGASPLPFHPNSHSQTTGYECNISESDAKAILIGRDGSHEDGEYAHQSPNDVSRGSSDGTYWQQKPPPLSTAHSATYQDGQSQSHPVSSNSRDYPPPHYYPPMPMASAPSYDSGYFVPPHPASFESHGSATGPPFAMGGPMVAYSYGPHPTIVYSGYPYQHPPHYPPPPPMPPIEYVSDIKPADVLCGRGGATNSHSGNRSFRLIVKKHQNRYLRAKKRDKPAVASLIVDMIRKRGGRFLRRCDAPHQHGRVLWVDIGDDRAREKTCQALREGAPELRRRRRGDKKKDDVNDEMSTGSSPKKGQSTHELDDSPKKPVVEQSPVASDARDDKEVSRGEAETVEEEPRYPSAEPTVIRPDTKLVGDSTITDISITDLNPREREMYLRDFIPPRPLTGKEPMRSDTFLIPGRYESADQDDYDEDQMSRDGSWVVQV